MIESVKAEILSDLKKIALSETTLASNRLKSKKKSVQVSSQLGKELVQPSSSTKKVHIGENFEVVEYTPSYKKLEKLKSATNRPPTPVASLESIVAVIIAAEPEDPPEIPHDYDEFDLLHITKTQKILLERNFILIKKMLKSNVGRQCLAGINFKERKVKIRGKSLKKGGLLTQEQIERTMARMVLKLPTDEKRLGQKLAMTCKVITNEILLTFKKEVYQPEIVEKIEVLEENE